MKQLLILLLLILTIITIPSVVSAQGMMGTQSGITSDGHTAREEAEGKQIWQKLQAKEVTCDTLSDKDFGALGESYMGQMTGNSHEAMNTMMKRMMGKEGEEQMHVVMGKRLSGCQPDAQLPQSGVGFMLMMWMMSPLRQGFAGQGGGGNPMMGYGGGGWNNMMGGWNGFGFLGWLPMLLFWVLLILGVVALLRYLGKSGQQQGHTTPLDILKERYARGEIEKKEFEEKKKELA